MQRPTHHNPPRADALAYRLGTYPTFLRRLLDCLPMQTVPTTDATGQPQRPLAALASRHLDDPLVAWLDAWAVLADVLTFYQERIANEGYLRTATELRSVQELVRMLGYEPQPGLAASALLALTVETMPGMDPVVRLAPGLKVQSLPAPEHRPQVFETVEPLLARPEWNLLRPYRLQPQEFTTQSNDLWLAGSSSGLRPGDRLLLVEAASGRHYVPVLQAVEPDSAAGQTQVHWGGALVPGEAVALPQLSVYAWRQRAALFGRQAQPRQRLAGGVLYGDRHVQAGLPDQPVQALLVSPQAASEPPLLLAATAESGVFRSMDNGSTWQACTAGLSNVRVYALCADAQQTLYAGAADGALYRSFDQGETWTQWYSGTLLQRTVEERKPAVVALADFGLPKMPLHALAFLDNQLHAGTDDGVYRLDTARMEWSRVGDSRAIRAMIAQPDHTLLCAGPAPGSLLTLRNGVWISVNAPALAGATIRAFASDAAGSILAGTSQGMYRRGDNNTAWSSVPTPALPTSDIRALAVGTSIAQLALAVPLVEHLWPVPDQDNGQQPIDLDATYTGSLIGSYVALVNQEHVATATVSAISTVRLTDFDPPATVTRLHLRLSAGQDLQPFYGTALRRTEVWLASEPLALALRPVTTPVDGAHLLLDGQIPALEPGRRLIVSGRRLSGDPAIPAEGIDCEVVLVEGTSLHVGRTVLSLRQPLRYAYERASVTVQANVVLATHGETIAAEVLGSGDGMQTHQRFVLKEAPLTYVPAASPDGASNTLHVQVNGVQWDEASTLHNLVAQSRSYQVRHDAQGKATLTFGDGVHGARLPSGSENIVATYRRGMGPEGNVMAHSLTLLQTRPLGVQSVTNPLPASGGVGPEDRDQARTRAPLTVLSLDRIVALADFEAFVRAFAGIGQAQATLLHTPEGRVVHITIADRRGNQVAAESALYTSLLNALNQRRNPLQPMHLDAYTPVDVELSATVYVAARYDPSAVQTAVWTVLQQTFGAGQRALGQDLASAEVVLVMQAVPGVVAVAMERLARTDGVTAAESVPADRCASHAPAFTARWRQGQVFPAELLRLTKIDLQMEMAT